MGSIRDDGGMIMKKLMLRQDVNILVRRKTNYLTETYSVTVTLLFPTIRFFLVLYFFGLFFPIILFIFFLFQIGDKG
jgi:hypothetical protein